MELLVYFHCQIIIHHYLLLCFSCGEIIIFQDLYDNLRIKTVAELSWVIQFTIELIHCLSTDRQLFFETCLSICW